MKWWIRIIWMLMGVVIGLMIAAPYVAELGELAHDQDRILNICVNELELLSEQHYKDPIRDQGGEEIWY